MIKIEWYAKKFLYSQSQQSIVNTYYTYLEVRNKSYNVCVKTKKYICICVYCVQPPAICETQWCIKTLRKHGALK